MDFGLRIADCGLRIADVDCGCAGEAIFPVYKP